MLKTATHWKIAIRAPVASLKLLIVEDSEGFRSVIRSSLASLSPEIQECSDGDQALLLYMQNRPDVVLMDIRMTRVNGLTATYIITAEDRNAKIIILTAFDDEDLREAARQAGASAYVLKDNLQSLAELILSLS